MLQTICLEKDKIQAFCNQSNIEFGDFVRASVLQTYLRFTREFYDYFEENTDISVVDYIKQSVDVYKTVELPFELKVSDNNDYLNVEFKESDLDEVFKKSLMRSSEYAMSQMIAKKFGYQHISMDSVIAGFEKAFPQVGIDTDADMDVKENVKSISAKIAPFLRAMMDSGEYDECDYGMVIDVFQLLPEDYRKYIDPSVCEIYYFITSDAMKDQLVDAKIHTDIFGSDHCPVELMTAHTI